MANLMINLRRHRIINQEQMDDLFKISKSKDLTTRQFRVIGLLLRMGMSIENASKEFENYAIKDVPLAVNIIELKKELKKHNCKSWSDLSIMAIKKGLKNDKIIMG